jgi:hypothetical protein
MYFAAADFEGNIIQCHHTRELLGHMLEFEDFFIVH